MAEKHRGMETNCELRQRCGRSREGKKESCTSKKKLTIHDPRDRCERISEDMSWYLGRHRRRSRGDRELGAMGGWVSLQVASCKVAKAEKCGEWRAEDERRQQQCRLLFLWPDGTIWVVALLLDLDLNLLHGRHSFTTLCT